MEGKPCLVRQLDSGESHTLALAGGAIYAWGRGLFGRLGTGNEEDQLKPVKVPGLEAHLLISVAAGSYHSLALTDEGNVWSWGYNAYGQLGRADGSCLDPCRVQFPGLSKVTSLAAGGMMSFAIDEAGSLWTWGVSSDCPMNSELFSAIPREVTGLLGKTVLKVSCGFEHVLVLASGTEGRGCFVWGSNSHGQLGLGDKQRRTSPAAVEGLRETSLEFPKDIACGAFHTSVVMQRVGSVTGSCWTFGLGENGQLGHGTTQSSDRPKCVQFAAREQVLAIDCGLFHSCCVVEDGGVFIWGMEGGFGLFPGSDSNEGDALLPVKLFQTDPTKFKAVVCGAAHTALLVEGGLSILAWGRGQHGVLGTGNDSDCTSPTMVSWSPPGEDAQADGHDCEGYKSGALRDAVKEIEELKEEVRSVRHQIQVLEAAVYGGGERTCLAEWERQIQNASFSNLVKYEAFYRSMRCFVKDVMLQRKVEQWCSNNNRLLPSSSKDESSSGGYSVDELKELSSRLHQLS